MYRLAGADKVMCKVREKKRWLSRCHFPKKHPDGKAAKACIARKRIETLHVNAWKYRNTMNLPIHFEVVYLPTSVGKYTQ